MINGTANYSDGLTGTEIKKSIQDFVAASEEPVTADDIVGFINGNAVGVGAGETSFGSKCVFNPASTSYVSVSALDATHFVVAYQDNGNSNHGTAIIGTVSAAQEPTLPCTCGDICVNTSGWWRDGGVFNASGTTPIQAAIDNATAGETIYVYNG
ncbi:MAG: hypothetical protein U9N09_07020, partial [Euryarchaeota archaeon]|nr:hypothetical protein [Euryarchaeota archaeon]